MLALFGQIKRCAYTHQGNFSLETLSEVWLEKEWGGMGRQLKHASVTLLRPAVYGLVMVCV